MMLKAGNHHVRFKPRPIEGTPQAAADASPDLLLLDGQQRLTSLFQALTGNGVVATKDSRNMLIDRRYLDMARAIGEPDERDRTVVSVPSDGVVRTNFNRDVVLDLSTPELERAAGHFPLRLVYAQADAMSWLFSYEDTTSAQRFLTDVLQPMLAYQIPAIELDESTTKSAVATVFEKVNTGGLALNVFELLTAVFAGDAGYYQEHGTDFRLNDDWLETKRVMTPHAVLSGVANTDFLQAVTLLASRERNLAGGTRPAAITARKEDVLKLKLADYLRWAEPLRDALVWAAGFLADHHIHDPGFVPYRTQIVPLAAFRVILGEDADLHGVRQRLNQWFWCGVLGELYAGATETRIARDVEQVPTWALAATDPESSATVPVTVADASFQESRLLSLRTRNSAAYKGIYALLMVDGCRDWRYTHTFDQTLYATRRVDIHHVFPRKWCKDNDIDDDLRESIVNKTPLSSSTNQYIGGASPAIYLPKLETAAGVGAPQMDEIIASHSIDASTLRDADFSAFFVGRRAALLALIEEAMGKPAQRDVEAGELVGGAEAPDAFEPEPDDMDDVNDMDPTEPALVGASGGG